MRIVYHRDPQTWKDKAYERRAKNPVKHLLTLGRRRARDYGLEFSITKDDIFVPTHCPLLGIPLTVSRGAVSAGSPTLDRIIPRLGYVPGNVWVISHKANTIKSDASLEELLMLAGNLAAKIRLKAVA